MVLDFVGGPYWDKHLSCLAQDGRLVLLGLVGARMPAWYTGEVYSANVLFFFCFN